MRFGRATVGLTADERQSSDEIRRHRRVQFATRNLAELRRDDLVFGRYDQVRHKPTGKAFRVVRGEIDAQFCPATHYYFFRPDDVVFLEPA